MLSVQTALRPQGFGVSIVQCMIHACVCTFGGLLWLRSCKESVWFGPVWLIDHHYRSHCKVIANQPVQFDPL